MVFLQRADRRQDVVRPPARRVAIHVDRHHELEPGKRPVKAPAIRRGENGIARHHEERANLAFTRGLDFLGHCSRRELAKHFRISGNARVETTHATGTRARNHVDHG